MQYISVNGMMCCGTLGISDPPKKDTGAGQELHNMMFKNPVHILEDICESRYYAGNLSAFYVFTDNLNGEHGDIFMDYIVNNKLGEVTRSQTGRNPNTTNNVVVYVWRVNEVELYEYATSRKLPISLSAKQRIDTWLAKYGEEYGEGKTPKPNPTRHKYPHWYAVKNQVRDFVKSALFE